MYLFYTRIRRTVLSLFSYEGIISIAVMNGYSTWGLLSVSISFTTGASRSFPSLPGRSCIFLSPLTHPGFPLHTAKPFGRYSAPSLQILYHFYEA